MSDSDASLGCEVNPVPLGCLTCPLPACKYDDRQGYQYVRRPLRGQSPQAVAAKVAALRPLPKGKAVGIVALEIGLNRRSVYRLLERFAVEAGSL